MREDVRDTCLLFLVGVVNQVYNAWVIFYPYLGSYLISFNQSIRMTDIYFCLVFVILGNIIGNSLLPHLFNRFQIRLIFLGASIVYCVNCLGYLVATSLPLLFLNGIGSGVANQLFYLGVMTYLKVRHPANSSKLLGISSCGYPVGLAMVIWLIQWQVNPSNQGMDYLGYGDYTFDPEISLATSRLIWIMALSNLAMGLLIYANLGDISPEEVAAAEASVSEDRFDMESLLIEKLTHRHTGSSAGRLITDRSTGRIIENPQQWTKIFEFKFIFIFGINIIHFLSIDYVSENYHLMSLFIVDSDKWAMDIYFIATISNLISRFSSGFIWTHLGLDRCYLIAGAGGVLTSMAYATFGATTQGGFAFLIFWVRFIYSFVYLCANNALFVVYGVTDALYIVKFYDLYLLVLEVINNILHRLLTRDHTFRRIFIAFFVLESAGLVAYLVYRKRFLAEISGSKGG